MLIGRNDLKRLPMKNAVHQKGYTNSRLFLVKRFYKPRQALQQIIVGQYLDAGFGILQREFPSALLSGLSSVQ